MRNGFGKTCGDPNPVTHCIAWEAWQHNKSLRVDHKNVNTKMMEEPHGVGRSTIQRK